MSKFAMNNQNSQRRVLNIMHNQNMPMLSNQSFDPLSLNQNQERNPESKINLIFGLLRKNTARTNGIWKVIQTLMGKINKLEELTASIDQVIARNKQLEDNRRKHNKRKNEKKRIKREKRKEDKLKKQNQNEQIEQIKEQKENENIENKIASKKEGKGNLQAVIPKKEDFSMKNSRNLANNSRNEFDDSRNKISNSKNSLERKMNNSRNSIEISRKKFDDSRNKFSNSKNNVEISRTNLINNKNNKNKLNNKFNVKNNDEISFNNSEINNIDECSLNLKDKMNEMNVTNVKLSRNNRDEKKVINLVNRFIFNNKNIFNSNQKWISQTFIPLIQDIIDLNLYEIDVTHYIRKIKSPPEFRHEFWQWWSKKQSNNIMQIVQRLKQSNDIDIRNIVNNRNLEQD